MLLVAFLAMSFPFGSAEIQMLCTIHIPARLLPVQCRHNPHCHK